LQIFILFTIIWPICATICFFEKVSQPAQNIPQPVYVMSNTGKCQIYKTSCFQGHAEW